MGTLFFYLISTNYSFSGVNLVTLPLLYPDSIFNTFYLAFSNDWTHNSRILSICMSTIFVSLPALFCAEDVTSIFQYLLLKPKEASALVFGMSCLSVIAIFVLGIYLLKDKKNPLSTSFFLCILILLSIKLPVFLYFSLYFCYYHSISHFFQSCKKLKITPNNAWIKSTPILLLTLVLFLIIYYSQVTVETESSIIKWVFITLFALTLPHMLLIEYWLEKNK